MRRPTDICLLCKEKNSLKKNSHLIPKFFGKGIFYGSKPRHGIQIDKIGHQKKVQDIIKENYLFCHDCEKRFEILETYCALRLERLNNSQFFTNFEKITHGKFEYAVSKDIDIRVFNLFIYSIIWRISISNNYGLLKFKLPIEEEDKLRLILDKHIEKTQSKLISGLDRIKDLPDHSHVIIRPLVKLRPPNSMLSAASLDKITHQLHLVDYLIFYITKPDAFINALKIIDNNSLEKSVSIGLMDTRSWKKFNFDMIDEMMNQSTLR